MFAIPTCLAWARSAICFAGLMLDPLTQTSTLLAKAHQQPSSPAPSARQLGTIKIIAGNSITLATDSGEEVNILVPDSSRLLRMAPGQTDLKQAPVLQLKDLQVGDRILVRGNSDDGRSVVASSIIVMKKADIAQRQQRDLQDWQQRGVGGLVRASDAASGNITISTITPEGSKKITLHVSKDTMLRRYAPNSVKFNDAKPGTLADIKPGDQLRARGKRNSDGTELSAEEIVSGSFRNIAGTVSLVDAGKNAITVMDLATKKPVVVRITGDSQMRKLPANVAQGIAVRVKSASSSAPPGGAPAGDRPPATEGERPGEGAARRPGTADLQQILSRMPPLSLADLQKGDAVMVVTTSDALAVTLLSGVEPILTASPPGSNVASLLTPWNLGTSPGDASGGPQ